MLDHSAMAKLTAGLYVLSSTSPDGDAGCIINTAMQVTANPVQIMVAVNKDCVTCQRVAATGHFALTALDTTCDMPFIGRFGFRSSADFAKFEGIPCERDEFGDPYSPEHACAMLSVAVAQTLDAGTHLLFVGEVTQAQVLGDGQPLTYAYYHDVLRGKTPPKASAYRPDQK